MPYPYRRSGPAIRSRAAAPRAARKPRAASAAAAPAASKPRRTLLGAGLRAAGTAAGTYLGGPVGGAVGHYLAGGLSKILGSGDYVVMGADGQASGLSNSQMMANRDQVPTFDYDRDGVVITHREYICDIYSSSVAGQFNVESFPINPGMRQTFPWLSDLVGNSYQQYKFESLVFAFKTFSADALNSTNTALGTVVSCVNYDSSDVPYTSRAQMENTDWAVSTKPSESVLIPVECRSSSQTQNNYYIRTGAPPAQSDIKTYDLGRLSIATLNFQGANVNAGSLYVTYKIRLMKPIQLRPLSLALNAHIALDPASVDASFALGSAGSQTVLFDNIGLTIDNVNGIVSFPLIPTDSLWSITYHAIGPTNTAAVVLGPIAPVANTGWQLTNYYNSGTASSYRVPATGALVNTAVTNTCLKYVGTNDNAIPQLKFDFLGSVFPASLTAVDLIITQLNSNQA